MKSALVPFFAKATIRTGYRGEMRYGLINDMRKLDKYVLTQTVQRYVALGYPSDAPQPPPIPEPSLTIDTANQKRVLEELELDTVKPVVGFMPGAEYGPAKQWPAQHYADLAKMLDDNGYQIWQFGSQKDKQIAGEIDELSGGVTTILCGKTALVDVVDLMAVCSTVVSNDSGLMHVAAATGIPVVGIYGSSTPDYTPPLTQNAEICYLRLECSPCFKRICPLGHSNCLVNILPETACSLIESTMKKT
jgi:heptosyltransferase-2